MAMFTALPVRKGDSFLLESGDGTVLVDGGISKSGLPGIFRVNSNRSGVDVLVCTHNDADHANGVFGFLDSDLTCREVWLPDKWASLLPAVLPPLPMVVGTLVDEIRAMTSEAKRRFADAKSPMELLAEDGCEPVSGDDTPLDQSGWPVECLAALDEAQDLAWGDASTVATFIHEMGEYHLVRLHPIVGPLEAVILNATVEVAKKVREIALLAYQKGLSVRWFKFSPSNPGGGEPWMKPVNSMEVSRIHLVRPGQRIIPLLALTTANKESLAFWAPPQGHGGVLFSADTDLAGVTPLPLSGTPIVTVPHHGSEENAVAITRILNHLLLQSGQPTWVRSDSRNTQRPGQTYLGLQKQTRHCTICRNSTGASGQQVVRFRSQGTKWICSSGKRTCTC